MENRRHVLLITKPDIHLRDKKLGEIFRYETTAISEIVVFAHNIINIFTTFFLKVASDIRGREEQGYAFDFLRNVFHFRKVAQVLHFERDLFFRSGIGNTRSRLQLRIAVAVETVCHTIDGNSSLKQQCHIVGRLPRRSWSGRWNLFSICCRVAIGMSQTEVSEGDLDELVQRIDGGCSIDRRFDETKGYVPFRRI